MATILLVDDDAEVLAMLVAIVQAAGHDVVKADNGIRALDLLDGDGPVRP